MHTKLIKLILTAAIFACGFCACNLDSDEEEEIQRIQFVTIENISASNIDLRLDNGDIISTELGETSSSSPKTGTRCIAVYREHPTPYRLYSIAEVPMSGIETLTPENKDSIGNDKDYYLNIFYVGGGYLNVYLTACSDKKNISLIYNPEKASTQDTAFLELRYNANNRETTSATSTPISFKLDKLRQENTESIVISVKTADSNRNFIQKWE